VVAPPIDRLLAAHMSARRPRTPKDPAAPKAATSAQQFFMKSRREAVKLTNPDLSSADLQKALADEWRELDEAGRAPFIAKAKTDKARHTKEASKYVPDPIHLKATKGGKRLQKDPLRPKKPKSAYLYFGEATRAELTSSNPGIRIEALSKLIGEEWRKLGEEQKAPYVQQAEADQERYRVEMADYEPSEQYLQARAAFKAAKKSGGAGSSSDALVAADDDGEAEELKEENASLKRKISELEAQVKAQEKQIDKLEKSAGKAEQKALAIKEKAEKAKAAPKAAPKAEPPAKKQKVEKPVAEAPVVIQDEAHYISWTKKVLGAKGEKADEEMQSVFESKGAKALVKLLAKKYKAEHK